MFPLLHHQEQVRMAERSKALRSGRSPLLWAWVRIPLLTKYFLHCSWLIASERATMSIEDHNITETAEWRSGSVLGP